MPEVYIDSLTIQNFGPFYGEHILPLSSLEGRSGILIGGKNGAGKTHILRALYLAIVGEPGVLDLRRVETGPDATRFVFDKSLNRRARSEGEDTVKLSANISHRDEMTGGSRKLVLNREIRYRPSSPPVWNSYCQRSDTPGDIEDEQVIQRLRDAFLPRHLARFFFFDAERSQSLNLGQQDIVEGVSRILGLWTYSELEDDLRQLIQQKIPRVYNSSKASDANTKLADLAAEVLRIEGHLRARTKEQGSLTIGLKEIEAELFLVEDELASLGAVDPDELSLAQRRREELSSAKSDLEGALAEAWEEQLPIALLAGYREQLTDYLISEEARRDWEAARTTVEPKIPQVKSDVFDETPTEFELRPPVRSFYVGRLESALHKLFHPPPDGMSESVFAVDRSETSAVVRAQLRPMGRGVQDLAETCIRIERMDAELRELDQRLKSMQQNPVAFKRGTELHEKRGELLFRLKDSRKRLDAISAELLRLESQLGELRRQETVQRELVEKLEKGDSLATLAGRYREAATAIRLQAADWMRSRIAENVGSLWTEISERTREFQGLEFDSHWKCWVIRQDGTRSSWEDINTSAGQRQVRMLAFYEALRRLARLVPPLVVDTPLARLDKEVRVNVLERLYLTGHQSIILATNSEVDPESELFRQISGQLGRTYTLYPHGKSGSNSYEVEIGSNYFGHAL